MAKVTITGMKASKGVLENGTSYDSTKVYVQTRLDESKGNAKGFATAEYNFGDAATYDKYRHLSFPLIAEVEYDTVTSGRMAKTIIVSCQPIKLDTPKAA